MTNKKTYSSKTKGKVAIATIKGDKTSGAPAMKCHTRWARLQQ